MALFSRPHSDEHELVFGLKFSAIGCALTLMALASCSYLIPEEKRPPRYNAVIGERRVPVLNQAVGSATPPEPSEEAYPVDPAAQAASMGVPPAGAFPAPPPGAMPSANPGMMPSPAAPNARMPQAAMQPKKSFWQRSKGWLFGEDAEIRKTPIPLGRPLPPGALNQISPASGTTLAMGSPGTDYPKLESVQEVPPASVQARDKLQQATQALKIDETRAAAAREHLSKEAVAEPTLLDAYKRGELSAQPQDAAQQPAPVVEEVIEFRKLDKSEQAVEDEALSAAMMEPALPPAPTVNVVRGTRSEAVQLRESEANHAPRGVLPEAGYDPYAADMATN